MAEIIIEDERLFPLVPKGWMPIIFIVVTLLALLTMSLPLATTDTYTALTPFMFIVILLFMLVFSPTDSWRNFKKTFELDAETLKDKIFAIMMTILGGISGYMVFLFLSRWGMTVLSFPSGLTLLNMGTILIVLTFFFVGFYEEMFHIWFSKVSANNICSTIQSRRITWIVSIVMGTIIWTLIHIIAVGFSIPSFIFIFSLGSLLRLPSLLIAKPMGREFYSSYFAIAFHIVYDISISMHLAFIL